MNHQLSEKLFAEAKTLMPGGVNSPVRAYGNVGATPPFIARAKGSHIYDVDGNDISITWAAGARCFWGMRTML